VASPVTTERRRPVRPAITLTVARTLWLTPHLVRVYAGGPGFESFAHNGFTDSYVKIDFPVGEGSVTRTYTVRSVDTELREIAIDFVVHGTEGVAGPWAASAEPGDTLTFRGPGGKFAPDVDASWFLLAGDETAVPAIAAAAAALPPNAVGHIVIEVAGPDDHIELCNPEGVGVTWVHRGVTSDRAGDDIAGDNAPLIAAVKALPWPEGPAAEGVQVFVHGEAQTVMHNLRPYLRTERGVPASRASISGYWRRGRTEEGFRQWKRELAESEGTARG
jgi:NADPH-dependent ferric siderophore reductase